MKLIFEPSVSEKIQKMKQRVRWNHPSISDRGIDQTSMVLDDGREESPEFSFMVIGDTGTKANDQNHPQRQVAEMMLANSNHCRFILHTGDVIYVVGSREYYPENFIEPYREFLVGGDDLQNISYDHMVFKLPILPVLGNHDYYEVPLLYRLFTGPTSFLRRMLGYKDIEIGWYASGQGDAYARAFLDYLAAISPAKLADYLDQHYIGKTENGRCLRYQPGEFTRLPNRYYTFCYSGIDFFALDSNTFNVSSVPDFILDFEQMDWLRTRLIESWNTPGVRGRVIFVHHPPYVTEATKRNLAETLAVRHHLRWVFTAVAKTLGNLQQGRSVVDLVLSGHAHCFEYLRTVDTGYADSYINYIISGGSGHTPRYQGSDGGEVMETFTDVARDSTRKVAESKLFIGRSGFGAAERKLYSCVRIDVQAGEPLRFKVRPLVTEMQQGKWCDRELEPFII